MTANPILQQLSEGVVRCFLAAVVVVLSSAVSIYAETENPDTMHVELGAVGVTARVPVKIAPRDGKLNVSSSVVNSGPALFGNNDAIRTLQTFADVHTNNDFAAGISVDGMDYSQNRISTNGARIFNPFHMLGLFSAFNASHYSGYSFSNVSAGHNVLGASLDACTAAYCDGLKGEATIGIINAAASVVAPVVPSGNTWVAASLRRSYFDKIFPDMIKYDHARLLYNFGDANLTVSHQFGDNRRVLADLFLSADRMLLDDAYYDSNGNFKWNNIVANVVLELPGLKQRLNWSKLSNGFDLRESSVSASLPSSIYELNYNGELAYKYWIFSADVAFRHSSPQHSQSDTSADANNALELSADVSYNRRILTNTSLSAGVTLTEYIGPSISRVYPLPRISITTDISGALSISLRAGALAQFSHLIKESDSGLPANFWINADNVFKPQHSWHGAIGASGKLLNGYLSYNVEAYCRSIRNLPEFTGCILNMANGGYRPLDDVMQGNGRSYGAKAMVALNCRKLRMWASCAVGRSELRVPEIADAYFPANYDRSCDFKMSGSYKINDKFDFSASLAYATGTPYTRASMGYMIGENLICEYYPHNSSRLPDYFRLDASLSYTLQSKGRLRHRFNVSAYNVTAHRNVVLKYYNYSPKNGLMGKESVLTSIIPSISYTIMFR